MANIQDKFKYDVTPIRDELVTNLITAYNAEIKSAYIYYHLQNCAEFIALDGTAHYFKELMSES